MSRTETFIQYFNEVTKNLDVPSDIQEFLTILSNSKDSIAKPTFTESGLAVLEYLQSVEPKGMKAKDIADGMCISSRKIAGAMNKLANDGYVEKIATSPVVYIITEKGKNINLNEFKGE